MKTKSYSSVLALGILTAVAVPAGAEKVDWNNIPLVVQRTINEQRGPLGVVAIERLDRFGSPVYEVRLVGNPPNNRFVVTETGTLVNVSEVMSLPAADGTREISFNSLPVAVQNTIRARLGAAPIQRIEVVSANGQTSYVVPFRVRDESHDLWLAPNGDVLATSPARVLLSSSKQIASADLPVLVRDSLSTYAPNGIIESVRKGKVNGETVYETTVNRQGRRIDLRLSENGALLRDDVNDRFLAQTGRLPGRIVTTARVPVRVPLDERIAVSFNQLPLAVKETVQKHAGSDFIDKIEKGIAAGQTFYQAVIRHAGETIPLRIAENGSLVSDDVNNWALARLGQSAMVQGDDDWRSAPARVTLADVTALTLAQLPLPVQNTIRYYGGGSPLHSLVQGTANGERVYQADLRWRGEDVQLRIAEDGSLVDDRNNAYFLSRFDRVTNPAGLGQAPRYQSSRGGGADLIRSR